MVTDPQERVERARQWLGLTFEHQGRGAGDTDCVGLVAHAFGYPLDKIPSYPKNPNNGVLERHLDRLIGMPVHIGDVDDNSYLLAGDLVAMQYRGPVRHVGIVADHPTLPGQLSLIHTDANLNKVTEHILDAKWLRRIKRVYR